MRTVIAVCLTLCLSAALALPASALEYTIDAPGDPDYGTPTSVEVIHTADGGALKNEDVSKNAALSPPSFGSPSADTPGTGTYLTPDLAPGGMAPGLWSMPRCGRCCWRGSGWWAPARPRGISMGRRW